MATQTAIDWSENFKKTHVDESLLQNGQDFVSSESIVLCARKFTSANYNQTPTDIGDFIAVGLVQNVSVTQNKQVQQLFEVGGRLPYFIPGRTIIQVAMSRVLINGPSLMKCMYATENHDKLKLTSPVDKNPGGILSVTNADGDSVVADRAFYINLASELFNKPVDLMLMILDSESEPVGGFFLRQCYIQSHQFGVSAQQTVLMESISIRCEELIPIGEPPEVAEPEE